MNSGGPTIGWITVILTTSNVRQRYFCDGGAFKHVNEALTAGGWPPGCAPSPATMRDQNRGQAGAADPGPGSDGRPDHFGATWPGHLGPRKCRCGYPLCRLSGERPRWTGVHLVTFVR